MAVKVIVKNKGFNGIRGGVKFANGVGVFEDADHGKEVARFFGYEVEPIEENKPAKKTTTRKTTTRKTTKGAPAKSTETKQDEE